ncbi:MAG: RNA recognition motif domain-containing protein [Gammaproteobacteria bacterium]|jgi:RNA recognition motif-containing protein
MNIYVGNLPYSVQDEELREAFEAYGDILSAEVIFDRRTQRSRGYGFVEMENDDEAREAIAALNGSDFQGRELRVDESKPKEEKPAARPRNDDNNQSRRGSENARSGGKPANVPAASNDSGGGLVGFIKRIFN